MKNLILVGLIVLLIGGIAWAETPSAPDPTGAAYGARPLGMGGAFVALSDDTNAIFVNPAGLNSLKTWSLTSMSTKLLQKVDYKLAGATYKIGPGTLGIGYIGTSSLAGYKYNEYGTREGSSPITYTSSLVLLSYGLNLASIMDVDRDLGEFSVGSTVKMISKGAAEVDNAQASGFDVDLGMTFKLKDSPFLFGAAVKNMANGGSITWLSGSKENLERSVKIGGAAKILGEEGLYKGLPGNLLATLDIEQLGDGKPAIAHVGTEYKPIKYLAIRAGLDQDPISESETSNSLTAGVGIDFMGFKFDYAYRANSDAAELSNHYFSLSYAPEELKAKEEGKAKEAKEVKEENKITEENKQDKKTSGGTYDLPKEYQNLGF